MVAFRCRPEVLPVYFDLLTNCLYDAPQSVESLWASDQPVTEISTWQHTTFTTDKQTIIHVPGGIYFVKHIFINPIVLHGVRQCTQQRKQVLSTWVYTKSHQVGGSVVQKE